MTKVAFVMAKDKQGTPWLSAVLRLACFYLLSATVLMGCGGFDFLPAEPALTLRAPPEVRVVPDSYIVTFRRDIAKEFFPDAFQEFQFHHSYLEDRYLADPRIKTLQYITDVDLANLDKSLDPDDFAPPMAMQMHFRGNADAPAALGIIARVDFTGESAAHSLLKDWEAAGELWFAEPNYVSELQVQEEQGDYFGAAAGLANAWWHQRINLGAAFTAISEQIKGGSLAQADVFANPPVIAVLDSGLDVLNPDIKDNVFINQNVGRALCDEDYNGCDTTIQIRGKFGRGSVHPYGLSGSGEACPQNNEDLRKNCPHGTHVAGIAAAAYKDGRPGRGGVCPFCKILPIKVVANIGGKGGAPDSAILNGLKYLTQFDASTRIRVANSSFGKYTRNRAVALAVNILKRSKNQILVVGAAGNEDSMLRVYPAALADAIAVSALKSDFRKASYSNYGPWVDVAAPGGEGNTSPTSGIQSTVPGGSDEGSIKSGTSMATPVVSGLAGLILAVKKDLNHGELRNLIIETTDAGNVYDRRLGEGQTFNATFYFQKPDDSNVRFPLLGNGVVDVQNALSDSRKGNPIVKPRQRVQLGVCAIAGGSTKSPEFLLLVLMAPLLVLGRRRRRDAR